MGGVEKKKVGEMVVRKYTPIRHGVSGYGMYVCFEKSFAELGENKRKLLGKLRELPVFRDLLKQDRGA
jgi:hypothetical protein